MTRCRLFVSRLSLLLSAMVMAAPSVAQVTQVTASEAAVVANNWLHLGQEMKWGWEGSDDFKSSDARKLIYKGELVGYCLAAKGGGYVAIPACRELPPITAYSTTSDLNVAEDEGWTGLLKEVLSYKEDLVRTYLSMSPPSAEWQPLQTEIEHNRRLWESYSASYQTFVQELENENRSRVPEGRGGRYTIDEINPLLTAVWDQGTPYNNLCPMGYSGRCYAGCTAIAQAQIIAYWRYPVSGSGTHSYTWNGDQSCGGSTPSQVLSATYSDSYDWANILNHYTGGETAAQKAAVAELCYEVGVSDNMDYGSCGSGAWVLYSEFQSHFLYASGMNEQHRSSYGTEAAYFAMLQAELNAFRPMWYFINTHAIVCDGWRISGGDQVHMNYGWNGSYNSWYTVDNLYCPWSGCTYLVEFAVRGIKPGTHWLVTSPNGGETRLVGDVDTIRWNTANFSENVSIELNRSYPSGGWESISTGTTNDGAHPWTVSGPLASSARVRVRGALHSFLGDTSNANFAIAQRSLALVFPNGGDTLTIGTIRQITWTSQYLTGNLKIELNRFYPGGSWETLTAGAPNTGSWDWGVTGPATLTAVARARITSVSFTALTDLSDANFTIFDPNLPPVLTHDPIGDFAVGTGTVTAIATDDAYRSVISVKMYYRLAGATDFDSLSLSPTGNPNEYAASLAGMGTGSYQYYLAARDGGGLSDTAPDGAPAYFYTLDVAEVCAHEMAYDDGSADWFNWSPGDAGAASAWAVQFGPVDTPFVLCGARFAVSRLWPDAAHSPVKVSVFAADGPGDLPGTLLKSVLTGSVGNVIDGLPTGTNWARVFFSDDAGGPWLVHHRQFYVAVANDIPPAYEAFGRDTGTPNAHRSFYYNVCEAQWYSEDDTLASENTYPGNRLIRAQGYSLASPQVVIQLDQGLVRLHWPNLWAPAYNVYLASASGGPFSLMHTTTDTFLTVSTVDTAAARRFYQVHAASE